MTINYKKFRKITAIFFLVTIINISAMTKVEAAVSASSLITLTNSYRTQSGLNQLSSNSQLQSAATAKANDMFDNQYFAHNSPAGKTPWDFINATGYPYVYAGENLAIGYSDANELLSAWMNSPTHRENILNPNFREIGMAAVSGEYEGSQTIIVVQVFGSTQSAQPVVENQTQEVASSSDQIAEEDTESPEVSAEPAEPQSNETTQEEVVSEPEQHTQTFEINESNTSFTPTRIFSGEEIVLKVSLKGEYDKIFFQIGEQKIDMADGLKSGESEEKNFEKKVKIDAKKGDLKIILNVTDKWGNLQSKDLGTLSVAEKVVSNTSNYNGGALLAEKINANLSWIAFSIILITLSFSGFLIFRYQKFGKLI